MSKNTNAIIAALLENDWSVVSDPGMGATAEATVTATRPDCRITVTHILCGVINNNITGVTATVQIRDASETGTVLWQHNFFSSVTTHQQVAADVYVSGSKGSNVYIGFVTIQASVHPWLNAQGFKDDMR
jgi:hypothetical protein